MNSLPRWIFAGLLASAPLCCSAADSPGGCEHERLDAHVRDQIQVYYARPNGEILAWDPQKDSVPTAMVSAVRIDNYREDFLPPGGVDLRHADVARQPPPLM